MPQVDAKIGVQREYGTLKFAAPAPIYRSHEVLLEYDAEAKAFSAVCPELRGCASAGDTEEEARRNIKEAVQLYLKPSDIELPRDATIAEVTVG
jgi:predicted RNase H-like HicB family nuclease